jgi:hypothetical protein
MTAHAFFRPRPAVSTIGTANFTPADEGDHAELTTPVSAEAVANTKVPIRTPAKPVVHVALASAALPTPASRSVKFEILPKGGKLALDGTPRSWFGNVFTLPVGPHEARVTIGSRCCRELSQTVDVKSPSPSRPDEVQVIYLSMPLEPATVGLAGAPANGQLSCPELALTVFGRAPRDAKLRDAVWSGTCSFAAPDRPLRTAAVSLRAGETNTVPWPSD